VLGGDQQRARGILSRPRNSTRVPATTRNSQPLVYPHDFAIAMKARRGSA